MDEKMDEKTMEMLRNLPHPPIELVNQPATHSPFKKAKIRTAPHNPSKRWFTSSKAFGNRPEELETTLWKELANNALKDYYERKGIKLELLGEVDTSPIFQGDIVCFHLDFQAKPEDDIESSPKKMFAEVFRSKKGEVKVTFCGIMDPSDPELLKGCRHCPRTVLHPPGMKFVKFAKAFGSGASC